MDRDIYRCPVTGTYFDPLAIQRRLLLASNNQINSWIGDQRGEEDLAAFAAEERIVPVVRSVFKMPDIDPQTGAGWLSEECLSALEHWLRWTSEKKVRGQSSPNESPCADCPPL